MLLKCDYKDCQNKKKKKVMGLILIKNTQIVNEGKIVEGDVLIDGEFIADIDISISSKSASTKIIDAEGKFLIPGVIDDQVHFREPGLTHKATNETESKAAVAGGITSYIEMPNTASYNASAT